jgi:hypothetical protein
MEYEAKAVQTVVLLRADVRKAVEHRAAAERRSLSNFLSNIIEDSVATDTDTSASAARAR